MARVLGRLPGTRLRNPGLPDQTRSTTIFLLWKTTIEPSAPRPFQLPARKQRRSEKNDESGDGSGPANNP